ncbi:MAG: hypothetical protein WCY62_02555 [Clostridia bacterium]
MIKDMKQIIAYIREFATDPFQRSILQKEICRKPTSDPEVNASKWYRQLADEQMQNGSWGRFHTQDTKNKTKRKFITTEQALRRIKDLSLEKDDVLVSRSIALMERYLRGDEAWTDNMEKHYGFETAFKTIIAANLSLFDSHNCLIDHKREIAAKNMTKACQTGCFDEETWEQENLNDNEILLRAYMVHILWLLQYENCISDTVQRQYLYYIWHREKGIYYISNSPVTEVRPLESKEFTMWLSSLEALCGFSLFPEFMCGRTVTHLYNEINRLIYDDVNLPPSSGIIGHYSENRSGQHTRRNDMILRIARILVKC